VGTGASEFIPLPFVDEWLIKKQRRAMAASILERRGMVFDEDVPKFLASDHRALSQRLGSFTRGLVMKPLKKVFRTVLFWLTVRNASRTAMETYFLARFLHHPNLVPGQRVSSAAARELRKVFTEVATGIDLRAAKNGVRQLMKLFSKKKNATNAEIAGTIERAAPGFIAEFDAMIDARLR